MADFVQEQINTLQEKVSAHTEMIDRAHTKAVENNLKLDALHERLDDTNKQVNEMKISMLTEERMASVLEKEFNSQVVRGIKWVLGLIGVFVATKYNEVLGLFR